MKIPFYKPYFTGREISYISQATERGHTSASGQFTNLCSGWMSENLNCGKTYLTHSAQATLEAIQLMIFEPEDEVIIPAFTPLTYAFSLARMGITPVIIDSRPDNFNMDERNIEAAITKKTKAILVIHFNGVGSNMNQIMTIAKKHKLLVVEDATSSITSKYQDIPLGSIGDIGIFSFHEFCPIGCGEGGALVINNDDLVGKAESLKSDFRFRLSEINAAFLFAQLQQSSWITEQRMKVWNAYPNALQALIKSQYIMPQNIPDNCHINGNNFSFMVASEPIKQALMEYLRHQTISTSWEYSDLLENKIVERFCRIHGELNYAESINNMLINLPVYIGLEQQVPFIARHIKDFFKKAEEHINGEESQ